jgi:hypothetical protein
MVAVSILERRFIGEVLLTPDYTLVVDGEEAAQHRHAAGYPMLFNAIGRRWVTKNE